MVYHPNVWRGWWDFGSGALGDMGCHIMDGACWSLKLGAPTSVEIVDSSPLVTAYRQAVAAWGLGYQARKQPNVTLPAFTGSTDLQYAQATR